MTSPAAMLARNTLYVEKGFGAYSLFEIQVYTDILNLVANSLMKFETLVTRNT